MPSWLETFANVNPFTIFVNAMRALWLDAPAQNYVWGAVVWALVILAVFAPLAVSALPAHRGQLRRRVSRASSARRGPPPGRPRSAATAGSTGSR